MKYKLFSAQMRECRADGVLIKEKCPQCGQILLMCKRYGGQCQSKKCLKDRMPDDKSDQMYPLRLC